MTTREMSSEKASALVEEQKMSDLKRIVSDLKSKLHEHPRVSDIKLFNDGSVELSGEGQVVTFTCDEFLSLYLVPN